ncbi:MAG TPA: hypothetical protein VMA31_01385 [Bryobacteraceae bacterium]|nr:hypothetical protein [Bryobacteraceae bacterium]
MRLPTGWFFTMAGVILVIMGLASPERAALSDANVNLYSGLFMTAFGLFLLALAWRASRREP